MIQSSGHYISKLDPLRLQQPNQPNLPELELQYYGFTKTDLDRTFYLPGNTCIGGEESALTLREIVSRLQNIYCHNIGIEYIHIDNEVKSKQFLIMFILRIVRHATFAGYICCHKSN